MAEAVAVLAFLIMQVSQLAPGADHEVPIMVLEVLGHRLRPQDGRYGPTFHDREMFWIHARI